MQRLVAALGMRSKPRVRSFRAAEGFFEGDAIQIWAISGWMLIYRLWYETVMARWWLGDVAFGIANCVNDIRVEA